MDFAQTSVKKSDAVQRSDVAQQSRSGGTGHGARGTDVSQVQRAHTANDAQGLPDIVHQGARTDVDQAVRGNISQRVSADVSYAVRADIAQDLIDVRQGDWANVGQDSARVNVGQRVRADVAHHVGEVVQADVGRDARTSKGRQTIVRVGMYILSTQSTMT